MADDTCRVYWGHSGCTLPRGHDPVFHRQLTPTEQTVTARDAYLFGEDLTEQERQLIADLWG